MNASNFSAIVTMRKIKQKFTYDNKSVLTMSIVYPEVALPGNQYAQDNINREIKKQVDAYNSYVSNDLYQQAVSFYHDANENNFPFNAFDTILQYEVTYNQNCYLSTYRDQYQFTGGAHGSTVRASDTWSLATGRSLPLSSFFAPGTDYKALLLEQILIQADQNMQENPYIYFEDYRTLIVSAFNENSYYLTPSGLAIYYQQYDIAPYATGIVVFTIPYKALDWYPTC